MVYFWLNLINTFKMVGLHIDSIIGNLEVITLVVFIILFLYYLKKSSLHEISARNQI